MAETSSRFKSLSCLFAKQGHQFQKAIQEADLSMAYLQTKREARSDKAEIPPAEFNEFFIV